MNSCNSHANLTLTMVLMMGDEISFREARPALSMAPACHLHAMQCP